MKKLLSAGHAVTVFDIVRDEVPGAEFRTADLTNYDQTEQALRGSDVVYHLAGSVLESTKKNPPLAIDVSLVGTANILQACYKLGIKKILYASSASVYHGIPEDKTVDETVVAHPFDTELFGAVKILGERLVYEYARSKGLEYVILRIGPVFGEGDRCTSIICDLVKEGIRGKSFGIWGDGRRLLQPTDIDDIAEGCSISLDSKDEVYNVISSERYSILEIAEIVRQRHGFSYHLETDKPNGQTYPYISPLKLMSLGWTATPLTQSIDKLVTFYHLKR